MQVRYQTALQPEIKGGEQTLTTCRGQGKVRAFILSAAF